MVFDYKKTGVYEAPRGVREAPAQVHLEEASVGSRVIAAVADENPACAAYPGPQCQCLAPGGHAVSPFAVVQFAEDAEKQRDGDDSHYDFGVIFLQL